MNQSDFLESIYDNHIAISTNSEQFIKNIQFVTRRAIDSMGLNKVSMRIIRLRTINKHTYMTKFDGTTYVLLDEHTFDLLHDFAVLYLFYGQTNLKTHAYRPIINEEGYAADRLSVLLHQLMVEGFLVDGKVAHAAHVVDKLVNERPRLIENTLSYNLYLSSKPRIGYLNTFNIEFYIYHELSHVKYIENPNLFLELEEMIIASKTLFSSIFNSNEDRFDLITQEAFVNECVCDMYTLTTLFDELLERDVDADFYIFYEGYYNAVMNLSEIETISITREKEKQDQVIQTGARISTVTNGLVLYYVKKGFFDLASSIPEVSNYTIEKSGNFYRQFTLNKNYFRHLVNKEDINEPKLLSKDWDDIFESAKSKLEKYIEDRDWI